jgi:hypothetical protein
MATLAVAPTRVTEVPPHGRGQNNNATLDGDDDESSATAAYTREVTQRTVAQVMKTGGNNYHMVLRSGAKMVSEKCDAGAKNIEAATARATERIDKFSAGIAQSSFEIGKVQEQVVVLRGHLTTAKKEADGISDVIARSKRDAELFSCLGITTTLLCILTIIAVLVWIIAIVPDAVGPRPRIVVVVAGLVLTFTVGASISGMRG